MVRLSGWVWSFLDEAAAAGFSPREETVTELLLVEMALRADGQMAVRKATVSEESEYGADFAWALRLRSGEWLSLLVQAKKLNPATGTYGDLAREKGRQQLRRLRSRAGKSNSLAVYLFYSDSSLGAAGEELEFGGCSLGGPLLREQFGPPWSTRITPGGCSLIPAGDLERLLGGGVKLTPAALMGAALPWECLLCPLLPDPRDPLGASPSPSPGDEPFDWTDARPWLTAERPAWASFVAEGASPDDDPDRPTASYYLVTDIDYGLD